MIKRLIDRRARRNGVRWFEGGPVVHRETAQALWRLDREMEAHLRQQARVPVIPGGSRLWTPEDEFPPTPPSRSQWCQRAWKTVVMLAGFLLAAGGFWCSARGYPYNAMVCWLLAAVAVYTVVPS